MLEVVAAIFATGVAVTAVAVATVVVLPVVAFVATGRVGLLAFVAVFVAAFVAIGVARAALVGVRQIHLRTQRVSLAQSAHTNEVTEFLFISISDLNLRRMQVVVAAA